VRVFDPKHTFRALRHRNFRLFFVGQGLSMMGTWLQQVAMAWLTYRWRVRRGCLALLPLRQHCHPRARSVCRRLPIASIGASNFVTVIDVVQAPGAGRPHRVGPHRGLASDCVRAWLGTVSAFDVPLRQSLYVHLVEDRADLPTQSRSIHSGQCGERSGRPRGGHVVIIKRGAAST
jgi:hypothetical protein